jgi:hypothetical protein
MYQITITKLEPNNEEIAKFMAEVEKYDNHRVRPYDYVEKPIPSAMIKNKILETIVNDEEFNAIRKACLEKM